MLEMKVTVLKISLASLIAMVTLLTVKVLTNAIHKKIG
jgi:hypothetical protein